MYALINQLGCVRVVCVPQLWLGLFTGQSWSAVPPLPNCLPAKVRGAVPPLLAGNVYRPKLGVCKALIN